jgi:hypothetical protein
MNKLSILSVLALTGALAMAPAADAQNPIEIGPSVASQSGPSVAVDQNGTAYVAWSTPTFKVDYCVLPAGASSCSSSGTLTPVGGGAYRDAAVVIDGGTVSILVEVELTGGPGRPMYPQTGVEEWQTPDGSANFSIVNAGQSVATAEPVPDTPTYIENAFAVPGTDALGISWFTPGSIPTFDEVPPSNPAVCTSYSSPACPYASLEPASNPDPVGNYGGSGAAETGSNPGILTVYGTQATSGPLGCSSPSQDGAAFAYGSGTESAGNSYNISPGQPNSAWKVAATQIPGSCGSDQWAVGGGPNGFGMLENLSSTANIEYQPFDQATMSFKPPVTVATGAAEDESSVSQDSSGGIYATYNLDGPDGPVALSYSSDGGQTWKGPSPLEPNPQFGNTLMQSAVGADGDGWAVWNDGSSVYAIEFASSDAAASVAATLHGSPITSTNQVILELKCFSVPCLVKTTLNGTVGGKSADAASATELGSGGMRITKHGYHRFVISLTRAGKRLLTSGHKRGQVKATVHEATSVGDYTEKNQIKIKIKTVRAHGRGRR